MVISKCCKILDMQNKWIVMIHEPRTYSDDTHRFRTFSDISQTMNLQWNYSKYEHTVMIHSQIYRTCRDITVLKLWKYCDDTHRSIEPSVILLLLWTYSDYTHRCRTFRDITQTMNIQWYYILKLWIYSVETHRDRTFSDITQTMNIQWYCTQT